MKALVEDFKNSLGEFLHDFEWYENRLYFWLDGYSISDMGMIIESIRRGDMHNKLINMSYYFDVNISICQRFRCGPSKRHDHSLILYHRTQFKPRLVDHRTHETFSDL